MENRGASGGCHPRLVGFLRLGTGAGWLEIDAASLEIHALVLEIDAVALETDSAALEKCGDALEMDAEPMRTVTELGEASLASNGAVVKIFIFLANDSDQATARSGRC